MRSPCLPRRRRTSTGWSPAGPNGCGTRVSDSAAPPGPRVMSWSASSSRSPVGGGRRPAARRPTGRIAINADLVQEDVERAVYDHCSTGGFSLPSSATADTGSDPHSRATTVEAPAGVDDLAGGAADVDTAPPRVEQRPWPTFPPCRGPSSGRRSPCRSSCTASCRGCTGSALASSSAGRPDDEECRRRRSALAPCAPRRVS